MIIQGDDWQGLQRHVPCQRSCVPIARKLASPDTVRRAKTYAAALPLQTMNALAARLTLKVVHVILKYDPLLSDNVYATVYKKA